MMPPLYRKLTQIIYSHWSRKVVLRIGVEFKTVERRLDRIYTAPQNAERPFCSGSTWTTIRKCQGTT